MGKTLDYGTEPEQIVQLFKSDFGREPEIWEKLEKGTLSETIAARQGTSQVAAPVKPTTTTPTPTTPNVGGLANRLRATQETQQHPAVRQATARLNAHGINLEDKMPSHYTPEMKAKAINNVTNGVESIHRQFPGMDQLSRHHGMTYRLQGPQVLGRGQLMGQYHPPETQGNTGPNPKIEINNSGEQTLFHEHFHFLDHAAAGMAPRMRATNTPNHPLRAFAQELQNHPIRQAAQNAEIQAAVRSGNPEAINHAMYRNQEDEVAARWFNSHMNYLHGRSGADPTAEAYDPVENEGWTPEHHEYFGGKLRDILKQHKMTRSFGEYLDRLHKALEETRQGRPLPGTQRATRMPQGYKVPRKITRPGVRGSTLWWYDEKGNVRYGPKPVQKGPPKDEPQHVKDYLQSERPWSFMSAYSESRPTDQNDQLHSQLGKELQANPDHEVYPSRGYYTDEQGQLREEPSYLVIGMTTKSALPIGQKYGQNTVLTHHGMFDVNRKTLAPIKYKRVESYDLPKDIPQTVVLTQPSHVTVVVQTGQPVPFGPSRV